MKLRPSSLADTLPCFLVDRLEDPDVFYLVKCQEGKETSGSPQRTRGKEGEEGFDKSGHWQHVT